MQARGDLGRCTDAGARRGGVKSMDSSKRHCRCCPTRAVPSTRSHTPPPPTHLEPPPPGTPQTALTLAVAEEACQFEHRDLHWGNLLIRWDGEREGERMSGGGAALGSLLISRRVGAHVRACAGREGGSSREAACECEPLGSSNLQPLLPHHHHHRRRLHTHARASREGGAEGSTAAYRLRGVDIEAQTEGVGRVGCGQKGVRPHAHASARAPAGPPGRCRMRSPPPMPLAPHKNKLS